MNSYFLAASALATLWLFVHIFLGGRQIARQLLGATDLHPVVRDTQYLCWHFTTVGIAGMAGFNGWAALSGDASFAIAAAALALGFALTGIGLTVRIGARHKDLPQGWLFLPVAALGALGLFL